MSEVCINTGNKILEEEFYKTAKYLFGENSEIINIAFKQEISREQYDKLMRTIQEREEQAYTCMSWNALSVASHIWNSVSDGWYEFTKRKVNGMELDVVRIDLYAPDFEYIERYGECLNKHKALRYLKNLLSGMFKCD